MNWKTSKEACTKAVSEFVAWYRHAVGWIGGEFTESDFNQIDERCLYDHFDALGIVIQIGWHPDKAPQWMYVITSLYKGVPASVADLKGYEFSTRTEAESAAFTRAFALREGQLNKQQ